MKKYIAAFCVLLMMLCTFGCGKGLEGRPAGSGDYF